MDAPLSPTTPVDAIPFTFVDVETTGLRHADGDRVCEIALLCIADNRETARFESLINPQRRMGAGAMAVHGISDDMLQDAPRFADLLPHIQPLLQGRVFVAHNASFDIGFLRHEYQLAGSTLTIPAVVDTLVLAQAYYQFPHNSLEAIAQTLGLPDTVRHRAMADVLTTHQILQRFITDMQQQGPVVLAHLMYPADQRSVAQLEALTRVMHEASRANKLLQLRYQASNGEETSRQVRPLEVSYQRGRGYLRAFCHLRQEERNFRFDRILDIQVI